MSDKGALNMTDKDGFKFNLEFLIKEISSLEEECSVAELSLIHI